MNHMINKYFVFAFICIMLASACSTPAKLNKIMNKLPEAAAKECAQRFPIKETVDTLILQDTALLNQYQIEFEYMSFLLDSVLSKSCDTVKIQEIKEIIKRIPAKPETKVIVKTIENTAKQQVIIDSCQKLTGSLISQLNRNNEEIKTLNEKLNKYKKQRNKSYWWILLLLILLFRKPLINGTRRLILKS